MKGVMKVLLPLCIVTLMLASVVGCTDANRSSGTDTDDLTVLRVGASLTPHAEILHEIAGDLLVQGIKLEVVEIQDYVAPNLALADGDLDANFYQHVPYLEYFNDKYGTDLVPVGEVHFEPMTVYAGQSNNLDAIEDGTVIAIPLDDTNKARSLVLLEAEGVDLGRVNLVEAQADALPGLLDQSDFAVINGNFALEAGIHQDRALAAETRGFAAASEYANVLVVRAGDEDDPVIEKLMKALTSERVREFILLKYEGAVIPMF